MCGVGSFQHGSSSTKNSTAGPCQTILVPDVRANGGRGEKKEGKKNRSSHIKHVPVEIQPLSVSVSLAAEKIMTLGSIFKRRISLFIFSFFFQYDTSMSCAFFWQFIYTLYFLGETFLNSHCSCFVLVATLALIGACAYRHLCIIL